MIKIHSYKQALKLQCSTIIISLLIILAIGWRLYPVNTLDKRITFSVIVLLVGGMTLWGVRKAGFKILCRTCKTDIFPFIDMGKMSGKKVNLCPCCGEKLDC